MDGRYGVEADAEAREAIRWWVERMLGRCCGVRYIELVVDEL